MKITQLTVSNFRCLGPEPVTVGLDDLTTFIGANGAGKTAVLQALVRLFGARPAERRLTKSDFHLAPGVAADAAAELRLWIEARLDFLELGQAATTAGVPECFRHMVVAAPGERPFCRVRLEGVWRRTSSVEGEIDEKLSWIMTADAVPAEDSKQSMSNYDRGRIQVLYVPATRDPSGQLRQAAGALLQPLLQAVRWTEATRTTASEAAAEAREAVRGEAGMQRIEAAIAGEWQKLQDFAPLRNLQLQPLSPDFDALLRQMEAVFLPGDGAQPQTMERLSDGLRSLFYFSMLGARFELEQLAATGQAAAFDFEAVELPILTVFAIEEPENHLAPHYLGRILDLLRRLATRTSAQVLLTSQSPGILGRVEPEWIRHLRLDPTTGRTQVRPLTLPQENDAEAFKYVKEAVRAYPELYFAMAVVLGEGDSEEVVLPRAAKVLNRALDQRFVSVVPLGGRHVNHFWRLLHDLGIPHVTLLDLDRERFGGGWARIHYAITQLRRFVPALTLENLNLTQEQLDEMPTWSLDDTATLTSWLHFLEEKGVFFSAPLDLDFMMLRAFTAAYQAATTGTGPRIPQDATGLVERMDQAKRAVLKPEGGDGHTYSGDERRAFIWYHYLFLGRGKPVTHVQALNGLSDEQLRTGLPSVLRRLLDRAVPPAPPPPPPPCPQTAAGPAPQ
jgi:hypothetical protein